MILVDVEYERTFNKLGRPKSVVLGDLPERVGYRWRQDDPAAFLGELALSGDVNAGEALLRFTSHGYKASKRVDDSPVDGCS
jgi:hypothetical protein